MSVSIPKFGRESVGFWVGWVQGRFTNEETAKLVRGLSSVTPRSALLIAASSIPAVVPRGLDALVLCRVCELGSSRGRLVGLNRFACHLLVFALAVFFAALG